MAKHRCKWCGRGSIACPAQGECISPAEKQDLCDFIRDEGIQWRAKLRQLWTAGSPRLRQVRNIIGPSGLNKMYPPKSPEGN